MIRSREICQHLFCHSIPGSISLCLFDQYFWATSSIDVKVITQMVLVSMWIFILISSNNLKWKPCWVRVILEGQRSERQREADEVMYILLFLCPYTSFSNMSPSKCRCRCRWRALSLAGFSEPRETWTCCVVLFSCIVVVLLLVCVCVLVFMFSVSAVVCFRFIESHVLRAFGSLNRACPANTRPWNAPQRPNLDIEGCQVWALGKPVNIFDAVCFHEVASELGLAKRRNWLAINGTKLNLRFNVTCSGPLHRMWSLWPQV